MIFGFSKTKQKKYLLHADEFETEKGWYVRFQLMEGDFSKPLSEWLLSNHKGCIWLLDILNMDDEGVIEKTESSIEMPFYFLMNRLNGQEGYLQKTLDLPDIFDGGIHLESHGLLHNQDYRLSYKWINSSSRPITLHQRNSGFLIVGERKYTLPFHAWKLAESLDLLKSEIKQSDTTQARLGRLAQFEIIKSLLPESEKHKFSESTEISSLKLFYANAFRIEAIPSGHDYKIRPVLLRRREHDNSNQLSFENILPPSEQNRYADNFNTCTKLLPYYNIGVGKYIVISEQLNKALEIVHKIQNQSVDGKLSFLKNPKAVLQENLEGIMDDEELEQIFSDRVIGLGEWQTKVIPWLQLPPGEWIPSGEFPDVRKGIEINGVKIELSTGDAISLIDVLDRAQDLKSPFIEFNGIQIPVTSETKAAIQQLIPKKPESRPEHDPVIQPESAVGQSAIMLVKENLETLDYIVQRIAREHYPKSDGIPDTVRTEPKPHQLYGFNWLCQNYKSGSRGVLLADDMGLGKTFQSLMFFSWLRDGMENGELHEKPLLIVAPTGLLKNWEAEIDIHLHRDLGNLVRAYGAGIKAIASGHHLNIARLRNAGLVLTTYETLNRYQTSFGAINFASVIFDEMQKLKNPGIQNYTAASSLNCDFWIGMTGTPVENRLCDLWSITDILQPGMLGSIKEFSHKYEKAVLDGDNIALERNAELRERLTGSTDRAPAFMLRRMKDKELVGLPTKHIHEYPVDMPEVQAKAYDQVIKDFQNSAGRQGAMLEALQRLRAYSLHPDYKKQNRYATDNDFIKGSARLQACFNILDNIYKKREKALIFVEYNDWHKPDFLCDIIKNRYDLEKLPMVINGQVNSGARQERVNSFQKDKGRFDVMLLSPRAGGVGLTLTAANHVIHLTRWWNPAVEDQATDRIYRIGQQLPVHVHYPMSIHPKIEKCFDFNLNQLLKEKRRRSADLLLPISDSNEILDELMSETFKSQRSFSFSLQDSYVISGKEFENLILARLQKYAPSLGYQVRSTPASWDGGADMIIESTNGRIVGIVQCKHVSGNEKSPTLNIDLDRASTNYGCTGLLANVFKIGITNATKISRADKNWLESSKSNLIVSGENSLMPESIFRFLDA